MIVCIYCGQNKPPDDEHVLAEGLGGDVCIVDVCHDCNNEFSRIDQALAERSLPALQRVVQHGSSRHVRLGGRHHVELPGSGRVEARVVGGMRCHIPPQMSLSGETLSFCGSDVGEKDRFVRLLGRSITKGAIGSIRTVIDPDDPCNTPRIVMHSHRDLGIRAKSQDEATELLKILGSQWPQIESQYLADTGARVQSLADPVVHVQQAIVPDDVNRAVAKTTFNYLALLFGAPFALRPEFDPIREYIRGMSLVHPSELGPDEIAVDTRYVSEMKEEDGELLPTNHHLLGLIYLPPTLLGLLTLYSHFRYVVRLGQIELHEQVHRFREFTPGQESRELPLVEIYQRMRAR